MSRGIAYGKLHVKENREAHYIWLTRDTEPDLCDCITESGYRGMFDSSLLAKEAVAALYDKVPKREFFVLVARRLLGFTTQEVADHLDLSAGRVRQIEQRAERICKAALSDLGITQKDFH